MICAVVLAGGKGARLEESEDTRGRAPKQYRFLGSGAAAVPILRRTVDAFLSHPSVSGVVVVYRSGDEERVRQACKGLAVVLCPGGATRHESVRSGLQAVSRSGWACTHVLIHDGVRPFVSHGLIGRVCEGLATYDAVFPGLEPREATYCDGQPIDRRRVRLAQTPQGFDYPKIKALYDRAGSKPHLCDDISQVVGHMTVGCVPGDQDNIKITDAHDLQHARFMMQSSCLKPSFSTRVRVGVGFDMHAFGPGDHVTLCGVSIPHVRGLVGHSDADVGVHALVDALLGSLGLGDIGQNFPSSDPRWKGVSSLIFLETVRTWLEERSAQIQNIDLIIVAQRPALAPHYPFMASCLASALGVEAGVVSVKSTTVDRLGCVGREEGVAAIAVSTVALG